MAKVFVSIGSNIERENNIRGGISALKEKFGELEISNVYESEPFGFEGDNFYNLVICFDTSLNLADVVVILREIEFQFGRHRQEERFLSRTLDIDLLLYEDLVLHDENFDLPREDVLAYSFVLCPLAEIAGDLRHPETGQQYAELWEKFDKSSHKIWRVELEM